MRTKKYILILIFLFSTSIYAQQSTRFIVVSDQHIYSPSQDFSQTIMYEITMAAIDEQVDFIFLTGDLTIRKPVDSTQTDTVLRDWRFVLDTLNNHDIKVFACRGNNDISSEATWDSLFAGDFAFPSNGPETELNRTYAIEYNNILFISLDQYFESHRINQEWLNEILATNTKPHVFAAGHEPAFKLVNTSCMGAYPEERNIFWESLAEAGAKIFFCGHDHFFDHAIIKDSTGVSNIEIHQVIVGTGGGSLFSDSEYDGDNGRWIPTRIFHENNYGYILVEVNDLEARMTWKHRTGQNIFEDGGDSYTFSSTSIDTNLPGNNILRAYPNPFTHSTTLLFNNPSGDSYTLRIMDLSGKICRIVENIHTSEYVLEKGNLKEGFCFVELRGEEVYRGRLLIE
jgi:predicted phosphodiesterase